MASSKINRIFVFHLSPTEISYADASHSGDRLIGVIL